MTQEIDEILKPDEPKPIEQDSPEVMNELVAKRSNKKKKTKSAKVKSLDGKANAKEIEAKAGGTGNHQDKRGNKENKPKLNELRGFIDKLEI